MTREADYSCPSCNGRLQIVDEREFECERCGNVVTECEKIQSTAELVRKEGFDELANRLEAAAEVDEVENGA